MERQSVRLRLLFEDRSILSEAQRSDGMNRSWLLIEPQQHRKISDVCNHLLQYFNLRRSCPNGIHLYMEGFVLPPSESTRILKDKEIICVRRKGAALTEAIEAADACNLLDEAEINRNEPINNGMLLLANEEFDKETGGYQSESDAEEEKLEDEPSPLETLSKKRKASTKLRSSKDVSQCSKVMCLLIKVHVAQSRNKKHRSVVMNDVKDEIAAENDDINNDECLPMKIISKKIKANKEKGSDETIIVKVKSSPKTKRKKKHLSGVVSCAEDDVVTDEIDNVSNGESLPGKMSKKKNKPNEETNKGNAEINDEKVKSSSNVKRSERLQDNVEGVEHASTPLDGAKKVPSRSARRKKAKRQWRRELAKISQTPETHLEPEVSKVDNKEANGHPKGPVKQDQLPTKVVHKNMIKQEERNSNHNVGTVLVPCVVRPGHIRFEPLDEDEDVKQIEVPEVAFQWNGITSKKKGQKWGLEKSSTFRRDDSPKANTGPSTMLSADTEVPVIDLNDFDKLPLCTSPKEGDVIAYRLLELTSSWTPELSSFRVGKISFYDASNIILMPVPEYPIIFDKMDEDGPDNSLYKEDGSLEIKFEALVDVRSVKQSNSDAMKAVNNGVQQTQGADKNAASNISNRNNNKETLSKDPSSVVANKEHDSWDELNEVLSAKKAELLEKKEEMKRDSGWNRWSYRALRGSALGPTMALLRSKNDV
ncbi:coilin-like isoform X2 [Cynara cardunculus var. scolymus]|uniref:coilin-like isoform X2 n=1 Tax=Cynara cardunculus var. scolymus TaxID=59895 RepID=UPI000D62E809|nr:coilin-like isoform X2 [Cynara cardunculus var. scolymus]